MKENNKEIAIYCRTAEKNKKEMENQKEYLRKYCECLGYTNYIVYEDYGYSAKYSNRPGYNKMISDLKSGKIDRIIVISLDKLNCNFVSFNEIFEEINKNTCRLISLKENIDTISPAGMMFMRILISMAEYEEELIKERKLLID